MLRQHPWVDQAGDQSGPRSHRLSITRPTTQTAADGDGSCAKRPRTHGRTRRGRQPWRLSPRIGFWGRPGSKESMPEASVLFPKVRRCSLEISALGSLVKTSLVRCLRHLNISSFRHPDHAQTLRRNQVLAAAESQPPRTDNLLRSLRATKRFTRRGDTAFRALRLSVRRAVLDAVLVVALRVVRPFPLGHAGVGFETPLEETAPQKKFGS
jgi:hypothetical protein